MRRQPIEILGIAIFCEECLGSHRGCYCNWEYKDGYNGEEIDSNLPEGIEGKDWKWITDEDRKNEGFDSPIEEKKYWVHLDEKGREYPCCEFFYEEEGFDIDKEPIDQIYEKAVKEGRTL